jgi:hypothetical protein
MDYEKLVCGGPFEAADMLLISNGLETPKPQCVYLAFQRNNVKTEVLNQGIDRMEDV